MLKNGKKLYVYKQKAFFSTYWHWEMDGLWFLVVFSPAMRYSSDEKLEAAA